MDGSTDQAASDVPRPPRFSSPRERRLWLWTLAVVVAIYSTLGLATTLADELRNRGLFDALFATAAVLVLATIVALVSRARPRGAEIGVALGVAAVYLLVFVRMGIPEERTHLLEYGVVAVFAHQALLERVSNGCPVRAPALLAIAGTAAIGIIDECIQALLPSRVFDPVDIAFNILAAVMAVVASVALDRAGQRVRGGADD